MQLINLIPLTTLASAAVAVPTEPSVIAYEAPAVGLNDAELEVSKRGLNGDVMRQIRVFCYLFKDGACNMQSPWRRVDAPGVSDMKTIGFNDVMSSFRCQYYTVI
ncbi:hypothetical protein SLS56_001677 [Neofusicoccum ribis]|uniref:Uncharacterized protein n=1 Tax=Neofusicoccum ribis TaxID=45134 RepID=A0ABR3T7T1_9PEZI